MLRDGLDATPVDIALDEFAAGAAIEEGACNDSQLQSDWSLARTRGESKKPVSRLRFNLSQLKHLREALSLFGVVEMDQKSTAWVTMEKILSAAVDRDVSDGKDMVKHSDSLESALLKNRECMQPLKAKRTTWIFQ